MATLDEALRQAARRLAEAGVPEPHLDARILLGAAAGIDRATLLRDGDRPLPGDSEARLDGFLLRRLRREPVSRILGARAFWGLDLIVTPDVLDPRPDTETLVETALRRHGGDRTSASRILDLGTGSGAILCALLHELPNALAWGVDRSPGACRVAGRNLVGCGFDARSLVLNGDWAEALASNAFDLIVSNPPYIRTATIATLEPDVRDHDPTAALDGGADGLDAYRSIAAQLPRLLAPGGLAALEVGHDQAGAVAGLLMAAGLADFETARDLAGHARVVSARLAR